MSGPPLPGLLEVLGLDLHRVTRKGEFAGACPWCGGRDRFRAWPLEEHPRWWCRGCDRKGDALDYLREREGLTYAAALERLGGRSSQSENFRAGAKIRVPPPDYADVPPAAWQGRGRALATRAAERLWSDVGTGALAYLRHRRGLADATIRAAGLGFLPGTTYEPAARWGLDGGRVWLPRGILLPSDLGGALWRLQVRRPWPADGELAGHIGGPGEAADGKYAEVAGSRPALYGVDSLRGRDVAFYVEGIFDCLLLAQEAGDLAAVVTMGSASTPPAGRWLWALRGLRRILAALDPDRAGDAAAGNLAALSARVRVARPLGGDLTEMRAGGGDLRGWAERHLAREAARPALTPCAVCGGPGARPWGARGDWCDVCVHAELHAPRPTLAALTPEERARWSMSR